MSTAMIYYLVNFPLFVLGYFSTSENIDTMSNILIFSLGGIFTGIIWYSNFYQWQELNKKSILRIV
jgi:hypothetical protein